MIFKWSQLGNTEPVSMKCGLIKYLELSLGPILLLICHLIFVTKNDPSIKSHSIDFQDIKTVDMDLSCKKYSMSDFITSISLCTNKVMKI